jgi:hypothetical protein
MNGEKLLSPAGRCEDRRFVAGAGRYTADLLPGGCVASGVPAQPHCTGTDSPFID